MFVRHHFNVPTLTSPPVLKLWDSQGYPWLPYDLAEVIKLIGVTFKQKNFFFFSKKYFMSFLPHYCHSFRITVIPSGLLSFLPYYCHSFRISVIPSEYCHSFLIITISKYLSSWIAPVLSHTPQWIIIVHAQNWKIWTTFLVKFKKIASFVSSVSARKLKCSSSDSLELEPS